MNIKWYGQSCFYITTSGKKDKGASIIIDPFDESIGLKLPRKIEADIALISHDHYDHNNVEKISEQAFIIKSPGEYDIKDVCIKGIQGFHDNVKGSERGQNSIYRIETEQIRLCHVGDLGQKELSTEQLEAIGDVDILMIPVGGEFTVNGKEAVNIMAQIEPKIIIPMHYKIPGLKIKIDPIDEFLKALGIKKLEKMSKLSIKEKDLPKEEVKIIQLEI